MEKLNGVGFRPWIGERYGRQSRFGVRVLVLGESHYDWLKRNCPENKVTIEVVEYHTQCFPKEDRRLPFFTKIANVLRGERGWIDDSDIASLFQEIAFYNFVQTFVGDAPRGNPTFRQWVEAQAPFRTVLDALQPDAVLVLGFRLRDHILEWPADIEHAVIGHPASSHLRYDEAFPEFQGLVERAKSRVGRVS
ncbi:MAG: hypothetical protein OXI17_05195 [Gammaproteobacteria bacterium]|nr:hypothetical protein [Gammaproteobacteria bacterium]